MIQGIACRLQDDVREKAFEHSNEQTVSSNDQHVNNTVCCTIRVMSQYYEVKLREAFVCGQLKEKSPFVGSAVRFVKYVLFFFDKPLETNVCIYCICIRYDKMEETMGNEVPDFYYNLSGGRALDVRFTTNWTCAKNNIKYTWRKQAIIE